MSTLSLTKKKKIPKSAVVNDSSRRNPRLNTGRSVSPDGRGFSPQQLTPEWGTLDNSVYVFPLSTV